MCAKKKKKGKARKRTLVEDTEEVVRPRRRSRKKWEGPNPIPVILLIIGASFMFSSIAMPYGGLDVETKIGIIPVTLNADVYVHKVSYEADLSGTEGLISANQNMSRKMSEERVYLTGLGDFQETVGFVKGSNKYKNHTIEVYTLPDNNRAKVVIETYADNIPWWPVGVAQDMRLTVKIIEPPVNITHVIIKKVWFELHQEVDGQDRYKVLWEQEPGDKLKKAGDSKEYEIKVTAEEDYGKFAIVGRAALELIDEDGKSNNGRELRSFSDNPKMINLWTVSTQRTVRLGLMIAAFPITMLAGALMIVSVVGYILGKRWAWKLALAGAILAILSVLFFMSGVYALIELTGYIDWFTWNAVGLSIPTVGAVMGFVGVFFAFVTRPPAVAKRGKGRRRKKKTIIEPEAAVEEPIVMPKRRKGKKESKKRRRN